MPLHFVEVELTGKEITGEAVTENGRLIQLQATRCGWAKMRQYGHQVTGVRMLVKNPVPLAVNAAVNRVNQTVTPTASGML